MNPGPKELITKVFVLALPILLFLGAVGNIFSFIIFSREKFRKTSFSLYFRVLAFTDTFTLLYIINDVSAALFDQDLVNSSYFMCKIFNYLIYSIAAASGCLLVVVSLDRMLSIIKPKKFLFLKKTRTQTTICFLAVSYNLTFYIPLIVYKDYEIQGNLSEENSTGFVYQCTDCQETNIVYWMDLFNSTLMPFLVMATSNFLTVNRLFKSRAKTMVKAKLSSSSSRLNKRDVRFAVTSAVLDAFFILCNFPLCAFYLTEDFVRLDDLDLNLFYFSTLFFYYLNFGVVFYVNFFTNALFRNELFIFLRLRKVSKKSFNNASQY
jgi:hypothetical protein